MTTLHYEWREIECWPAYEVSSLGDVRRKGAESNLKTSVSNGYLYVPLCDGNRKPEKRVTVHSLVAAAFIGPRPVRLQVNHIDGNKANPAATNLEYVTARSNHLHAARLGLSPTGERHPKTTLSAKDVKAIKALFLLGNVVANRKAIAARFRTSLATVYKIGYGQTWKYLSIEKKG